jgi:hypothetical protein
MKAPSIKSLQIDKSSQLMLVFASIGIFLLVFSLLSSKSLLSQMNFQNKYLNEKNSALNKLKTDLDNENTLNKAYNNFISQNTNLIGGLTSGTGSSDGNNAKIILDALPSEYDFPALGSSLQKLLISSGVIVQNLSASNSAASNSSAATVSGTTQIPFSFTISGAEANVLSTLKIFENSIRPFYFSSINVSGNSTNLIFKVNAVTFYQNAQSFNIGSTTVQ